MVLGQFRKNFISVENVIDIICDRELHFSNPIRNGQKRWFWQFRKLNIC